MPHTLIRSGIDDSLVSQASDRKGPGGRPRRISGPECEGALAPAEATPDDSCVSRISAAVRERSNEEPRAVVEWAGPCEED